MTHGWDYDQSGIVVTVGHERDHQGRAEEHFLPAGPFAILPLKGKRSSLVWTESRREAARIVDLPADEFKRELETRFGLHLGELSRSTSRAHFRSVISLHGLLSRNAWRSLAMRRMSSIPSQGRASTWVSRMRRHWRR